MIEWSFSALAFVFPFWLDGYVFAVAKLKVLSGRSKKEIGSIIEQGHVVFKEAHANRVPLLNKATSLS